MIKYIAHRGNNQKKFLENSYAALMDSINDKDVDGIELDVRITKDNQIVVIHDMTVDRLADTIGVVREKTLAELKDMKFKNEYVTTHISTLNEILHDIHSTKIILIDIKEETGDYKRTANEVAHIVDKHPGLNIYLGSFHSELVHYLHKMHNEIKVGLFITALINQDKPGYDFRAIKYEILENKDMKTETFTWTVDTKEERDHVKEIAQNKTLYIVTNKASELQSAD